MAMMTRRIAEIMIAVGVWLLLLEISAWNVLLSLLRMNMWLFAEGK
jgi:hypothetical protein